MTPPTEAPVKPLAEMTDEERAALTDEERGELEGAGESEQAPPPIPKLAIEGPRQLSMEVGGRAADASMVKMKGGKIALPKGALQKGDSLSLIVKVRVDEVRFVDTHDEQGAVTGTERQHICKPIGVERV